MESNEEKPQEETEDFVEPAQKVTAGLSPYGVVLNVTSRNGDTAQAILNPDEAFTLSGHLMGISTLLMQMGIQSQMAEQAEMAEIARKLADPVEKSKGGVYLNKKR